MYSDRWNILTKDDYLEVFYNCEYKGNYNRIINPCTLCGYPLESNLDCSNYLNHPKYIDRIYSVGLYIDYGIGKDFLSKHVNWLKNYSYYAQSLGLAIYKIMIDIKYEFDFIMYVPQHSAEYHVDKDSKIKFDQAQLLAKVIQMKTNKPLIDILKKNKSLSQRGQSAEQRRENVKGLYQCDNNYVNTKLKNQSIVLIDDVITTGADIDECAKVLRKYEPKRIDGFACGITMRND